MAEQKYEKTYKKFDKMTKSEKDAFKQGVATAKSQVQSALGFRKPKKLDD